METLLVWYNYIISDLRYLCCFCLYSLLDVLEVIAPFKHFGKLREFMQTKLPPGFPVKIGELVSLLVWIVYMYIWLIWVLHYRVAFSKFLCHAKNSHFKRANKDNFSNLIYSLCYCLTLSPLPLPMAPLLLMLGFLLQCTVSIHNLPVQQHPFRSSSRYCITVDSFMDRDTFNLTCYNH